jgi:hypothetical protein
MFGHSLVDLTTPNLYTNVYERLLFNGAFMLFSAPFMLFNGAFMQFSAPFMLFNGAIFCTLYLDIPLSFSIAVAS